MSNQTIDEIYFTGLLRYPRVSTRQNEARSVVRIGGARASAAAATATTSGITAPDAIPQDAAIGQHDVFDAADRILRFCLVDVHGDDVTWRQRRLRPSDQAQRRWAAEFSGPMNDLTL